MSIRMLMRKTRLVKGHGDLFERFSLDENTGCWNWTINKNEKGYGQVTRNYTTLLAHRLSAALFKGFDRNSRLQVLHLCNNPSCVNPKHLVIGTQKENIAQAVSSGRMRNQKKTHCAQGHLLSGDNLYYRTRGDKKERSCKTCRTKWSRQGWQREKSKRLKDA